MWEAERTHGGESMVGGESMCGSPPAVGGAGGVLESPQEGGGCVLLDRRQGEECEPWLASEKNGDSLNGNGRVGGRSLDGFHDAGYRGLENAYLVSDGTEMLDVKERACFPSCDGNVSSLDIEHGSRVLVEEEEEVQEGCGGLVGAEEASGHVILKVEPVVETPEMVNKENCRTGHAGLENGLQMSGDLEVRDGYSVTVNGDDSLGVSVKEVKQAEEGCRGFVEAKGESMHLALENGRSKETFKVVNTEELSTDHTFLENGYLLQNNSDTTEQVDRAYSHPCDSYGSSVEVGNCSGVLVNKENKEVDDRCGRFVGAEKESKHLFAEHRTPGQSPKVVNEDEHDDFPGLSPLRTLEGDGSRNSSGIGIGLEGGYIAVLFDDIKDCSGCDNALLVSSELPADFPLRKTSEGTTKHIDRFCCPLPRGCLDASTNCNVMLCSKDGSGEQNQLLSSETVYCPTMEFKGAQKEQQESGYCSRSDGISIPQGGSCQNLMQGSSDEVGSCSVVEGLFSQQSSNPFTASENCPSNSSLGQKFLGNDSDACNTMLACCGKSGKDFCGQLSDGGTVNPKPVPLIVFRRTNPKRAASSRKNLSEENLDPLSRTKNTARKCRKAINTKTSISSNIFKISDKVTRKRSCSHRPVRHSVWGEAENILRIFKQNGELAIADTDPTQIQNKRSKKGRRSVGRKIRQTTQKDGHVRLSKTKCAVSTNSGYIKDQMDVQPTFPVVVYSRASVQINDNVCLPNLDCHTDSGISSNVEVERKLAEDRHAEAVRLLQQDGQQGDRDVESTLTQETSVDNMLGECLGVSSQVGSEALVETMNNRHLLDPGSSPDSDVYNPVMDVGVIASENATSTSPDAGLFTSALVPVPVVQDDLPAAALTSFETILSPVSTPSLDIYPKKNSKKGKKGKKGKKCLEASVMTCAMSEHPFIEEKSHGIESPEKAGEPLKINSRLKGKKQGSLDEGSPVCSKSISKAAGKSSRDKTSDVDSAVFGMVELEICEESTKKEVDSDMQAQPSCGVGNRQSAGGTLGASLLTDQNKGHKLPRSASSRVSRSSLGKPDSARHRRKDAHGQKKNRVRKTGNKSRSKEKSQTLDSSLEASGSMSLSSEAANQLALTGSDELICKTNTRREAVPEKVSDSGMAPVVEEPTSNKASALEGQSLPSRVAWVCCDDCHKWRCISAALADSIDETNCRWTCRDNTDKAFADCLIPQEKTNAEINAELEISDASCDEDFSCMQPSSKRIETSKLTASQQSSWALIKSNLFLHRNRKTQTIDEIMVCQCKSPSDGSLGCGDACLNRMLNIECVKGTCPCGDLCSNQQFQQHKYAKFKWFRCGKKGYGLQLLEDVSQGQFLIEYVGEVLDLVSYEARQRNYASRGQKHFYFMTLNGGEVIDACAKGNLGRFINHSCNPNCRTEKWMVNGEVCIGLFAIRDIKKSEEVTFDYNYVRVFGAAAKKCVCGAPECRGYIGGDPLNTEVIVQDDSDDDYPEPVMIQEDGERELDVDKTVSDAMDAMTLKHEDVSIENKDLLIQCAPTTTDSEDYQRTSETTCRPSSDVNSLDASCQTLNPIQTEKLLSRPNIHSRESSIQSLDNRQTEETMSRPASDVQPTLSSLQTSISVKESVSDSILNSKTSLSNVVDDKRNTLKTYPAKSSRSSSTIKKSKSNVKSLVPPKAKKLPTSASSGHFEGVEEKLNELLDEDGGISKRKDAAKGYLKLLFVTAAGGDRVGGCASQSIRDLSLILDALLKTKSRTVLVDIINKNGLQMLHNIMKQNRSKFNRIPIIRKLLKVLEFLALKEILTPEHMNQGPPCSGMESFRDSILSLTRHNDMQVHQIARNFRDKWIPRTIRRVEPSDRDDGQLDSQHSYRNWFESEYRRRHDHVARDTDAIVCVSEAVEKPTSSCLVNISGETSSHPGQLVSISSPVVDDNTSRGTRTRKRRSRWDQPSDITVLDPRTLWSIEDHTVEAGLKFIKATNSQSELGSRLEEVKKDFGTQGEENSSFDEVASVKSQMQQNLDDEAPPGFGSPQRDRHPQVSFETSVTTGEVVMGCIQERFLSHLSVSYGIPLTLMQQLGSTEAGGNPSHPNWLIAPAMPFHPFPPLPPYPRGTPNPTSLAEISDHSMTQAAKEMHLTKRRLEESLTTDLTVQSTSGEGPADIVESRPRSSYITGRARWPSSSSGRRFIRPQKWNNQRFQRCWPPWPREKVNGRGCSRIEKNGDSGVGVGNLRDGSDLCFSESVSNDVTSSNCHQPPQNN
ncbi:putative histone-lysine N-methyltransferase ASHH2-like [Cocos nucifera]|uniref:Putative histone-lysine N-methyltransferase ASHH2-like n=1 Tax=Cocos nucifera TaxID=13894 RepID=A0A8K0IX84_COCNU|nr:putative histone-lysine N-methyltransferase ASHH2-like [Cocos nucifera]